MPNRRDIVVVLSVVACLPACAVLDTLGLSEPKASSQKVEARAPAPAPVPIAGSITAAAPPVEGGVQESEGAPSSAGAELVPAPSPPPDSKEGPPASPMGTTTVPSSASAPPANQQGKPQYVSLNFDNAELELVLRSIADITGINFIIGPGVKANVTMRTTTRIPASEVFSIMELVLALNNLVAVKEGSFYKIVPIAVAQQEPQDVQVGKERIEERDRYITQIVNLDYLSADEMARILQPFLARGAKLLVHKETNSLIIAGFSSTVKRLLETIKVLDIQTKRDNIQRIFVYFVENVKATQLASLLNTLYGRRTALPGVPAPGARPGQSLLRPGIGQPPPPSTPVPGQPQVGVPGEPPPGAPLPPAVLLPSGAEAAPGEVVGEVTIVPDEATNALIIKTSPRNYEIIEATIKKLDIVPKQVIIEALLAEVSLSDAFNFSLEEVIRSGTFLVSGVYGSQGATAAASQAIAAFSTPTTSPPAGFTLTFVDRDKFRVVLNNLAAVTKVNILAAPHLLTANNKEAKLQIGSEVPIITNQQASLTTVSTTPGTTSGVFRTLQQKDIGILLGIKPHVNEKRLVTLDIETEQTDVLDRSFGDTGSPAFSKRSSKTSIVVQDGQSIALSGIIQNRVERNIKGIPFLSQIPLLGYLFRSTSDSVSRTELVILITPYVIASPEEGKELTERFRQKIESVEPLLRSLPKTSPSGLRE